MAFTFTHVNFNVLDLARSMDFYERAFGFREKRRLEADGFTLVYLWDGATEFELELTHLDARTEPYNLGEKEFHLALTRMIMRRHVQSMQRWALSATKIQRWGFTLSRIRMDTGLKFCQKICDEGHTFVYNRGYMK